MKDYVLKNQPEPASNDKFLTGLVFGFDVGTGSIGYAVRRGPTFLDVGVLICDSEGSDLSKRRDLRRQRRTLRSKKYRRQWFAQELLKLGLSKPQNPLDDPVSLRLRALNGDKLKPEELFAALTHLFKRRGYSKVPWANVEKAAKENAKPKADDDEGVIKEKVKAMQAELGDKHPCQLLAERRTEAGKSPTENWARKIYWPREVLQKEFLAIVAAQKKNFPQLTEKAEWLLHGDSQPKTKSGETFHVFFKTTEARNPGVLGLRWPRFDNRGPALDSLQPVDGQGRPMHVVRKKQPAYQNAQWAMALLNFRVQNPVTRAKFAPSAKALEKLREVWETQQAKNAKRKKKPSDDKDEDSAEVEDVTITRAVLKQWVKTCCEELKETFALVEGQRDLTPKTGAGRARFNSLNLAKIQRDIEAGNGMPSAQTILRRDGETNDEALNRYLTDIKHPLVRHRLTLIRKLISDPKNGLIARFGVPDCVVVEAVRKLAMSDNSKRRLQAWQDTREEETDAALTFWREKENTSPQKKSLEKWKLWRELSPEKTRASRCPYCLQPIVSSADETIEVEHIVPYRRVFCNEFYNKTVAHRTCNAYKGNRTPYEAFASNPKDWPVRWKNENDPDDPDTIVGNARQCFRREFHFSYQHTAKINGKEVKYSKKDSAVNSKTKLDLFISPNAEALIEEKSDLVQTAYIAKVLRHVSLLLFDRPSRPWLKADGTDPTDERGNHPSQCYLVTNGSLTKRLRQSWGLNQILHPLPSRDLPPEELEKKMAETAEKNRGDLRHHSLDAMVIACTLPWLAHRTHGAKDAFGRHGWWTQDEKQRSKAANPLFPNEGQMHDVVKKEIDKVTVKHHVSRSNHQQAYATTLYSKKAENTYVAREVFTSLTPKNLGSIWPETFASYCEAAWRRYSEEAADLAGELKRTKNCVPESFTRKLCFSHFQKWRQDDCPEFYWPKEIKIPIRNVRLISVKDDTAVVPFSPGTHAYVRRKGFKEVQVFLAEDAKSYVPVFIPYWKKDKPISSKPVKVDSKPIAIIRRGGIVTLKKVSGPKNPIGNYRVVSTMQAKISLVPTHIQDTPEALLASGLLANGVNISWQTFFTAAGYELPPSPSVKSEDRSDG